MENIYYYELKNEELRNKIQVWHKNLQENKGERARLRRCKNLTNILLSSETHKLQRYIKWPTTEALTTIVGILSNVTVNQMNHGLGYCLAKSKNGKSIFSESRFKKLISSRNFDELFVSLKRAIKMIKGQVNPIIVADTILQWDKKFKEEKTSLNFNLSSDYYSIFSE